jgi:hypothetical protein
LLRKNEELKMKSEKSEDSLHKLTRIKTNFISPQRHKDTKKKILNTEFHRGHHRVTQSFKRREGENCHRKHEEGFHLSAQRCLLRKNEKLKDKNEK